MLFYQFKWPKLIYPDLAHQMQPLHKKYNNSSLFELEGQADFKTVIDRANFKTFQFGQGQGGRIFQPEEYIEYFED